MSQPINRRDFTKAAALAAAGLATPTPAAAAAAQPPATTDVQALYDLIRARYGKYLDANQLQDVRDDIEGNVRRAAQLRKFPVGDVDPAFVFSADA
jgi:hypothetical protein